ncbi:hypothetical protein [Arthrobacter ginkgonis]
MTVAVARTRPRDGAAAMAAALVGAARQILLGANVRVVAVKPRRG